MNLLALSKLFSLDRFVLGDLFFPFTSLFIQYSRILVSFILKKKIGWSISTKARILEVKFDSKTSSVNLVPRPIISACPKKWSCPIKAHFWSQWISKEHNFSWIASPTISSSYIVSKSSSVVNLSIGRWVWQLPRNLLPQGKPFSTIIFLSLRILHQRFG